MQYAQSKKWVHLSGGRAEEDTDILMGQRTLINALKILDKVGHRISYCYNPHAEYLTETDYVFDGAYVKTWSSFTDDDLIISGKVIRGKIQAYVESRRQIDSLAKKLRLPLRIG